MKIRDIINIIEESELQQWPSRPIFHGTSSIESARSIMLHGLDPSKGKSRFTGKLKPMSGKSYLSESLFHVIENYAFPEGIDNRTGFVLVFDRDSLNDVEPDEDAVKTFMSQTISNQMDGNQVELRIKPDLDISVSELASKIINLLSQQERTAIYYGSSKQRRMAPIAFGKKIIPYLNKGEKSILMDFDWHHRVATHENLKPVSCWSLNKKDLANLGPGCKNFRKIAVCIS